MGARLVGESPEVTWTATEPVPALLLKGPAFARWLYDDSRERSYRDIDLLVAPERIAAAGAALSELGFERRDSHARHHRKQRADEQT